MIFFFSSRRRHTRLQGDWSSDVCSSDLYVYQTSDAGRFRIDLNSGRIEVPRAGDLLLREQRLHGMPMILSFLSRGEIGRASCRERVEISVGALVLDENEGIDWWYVSA